MSGEGSRGGSSPRVRAVRFVVAGFRRLGMVSRVCRAGRWQVVRLERFGKASRSQGGLGLFCEGGWGRG